MTGLGGRVKLMNDLTLALRPGSPPSLLAIVCFEGFGGRTRRRGDRAQRAALVERCSTLARGLEPVSNCYRLREAELAALVYRPAAEASELLDGAVSLLQEGEPDAFHPISFGACILPKEAASPLEALALAGERLTLGQRGRESREQAGDAEPATNAGSNSGGRA